MRRSPVARAAYDQAASTLRENEVLRLAKWTTTEQIARQLHIGSETVSEHIHCALRKIGVSDRTQAAVWALRQGLVLSDTDETPPAAEPFSFSGARTTPHSTSQWQWPRFWKLHPTPNLRW
jgi:DNA-binding CsgD family transcriptional regulator